MRTQCPWSRPTDRWSCRLKTRLWNVRTSPVLSPGGLTSAVVSVVACSTTWIVLTPLPRLAPPAPATTTAATAHASTTPPTRANRVSFLMGPSLFRGLREAHHDVLHLAVVLERVDRQVLAVAGLLVAAVRHLGRERDVVVDPHAAELERVGDAVGAGDGARPDRGGEA